MTGSNDTHVARAPAPRSETPRQRRQRLRRQLLAALALVLIIASPFLAVRIGFVRGALLTAAVQQAGLGDDYRVSIEKVRRFDPLGFHFVGVQLQHRDSTGLFEPAIHLGHLAADWSLTRLLVGEIVVKDLQTGAVRIWTHRLRASQDSAAAPVMEDEGRRARSMAERMPISIDHVRMGPVEIHDADDVLVRFGIAEAEFVAAGRDPTLFLREGWLALDRYGVGMQMGQGVFVWRGRWGSELTGLQLEGPRLRGQLRVRYDESHPGGALRCAAFLDHLDPRLLTRNFAPGIRLRPEDRLAGSVSLELGQGTVVEFLVAGQLRGEAFDALSALIEVQDGIVSVRDALVEGESGQARGEGQWDGPGRKARGQVRWEQLDPRTRWLPWLADVPVRDRFSGAGNVLVHAPHDAPPRIEGEVELRDVRPLEIDTERIRFRGYVEPGDAVSARDLVVTLDGGRLQGSGRWPLGSGDVKITAQIDSFPVSALPAVWRDHADGRLSGAVTLSGIAGDPVIEGNCQVKDAAYGDWTADRITIAPLLIWPRDVRGSATVECFGLRRGDGQAIRVSSRLARWNEQIAIAGDLRLAGLDLHAEGQLDVGEQVAVSQLHLASDRWGRWRLERPVHLRWRPDLLAVDSLILNSGRARLAIGGRWVRETGDVHAGLRLERFDLAHLNADRASGVQWRGVGDLRLDVSGQLPDPACSVGIAADSVALGPAFLGEVAVAATWRDSTLRIEPLSVRSPAHEIDLPELVLSAQRPLLEVLTSESQAGVPGPLANLATAPWSGRVHVRRCDLAAWAPALGLQAAADSAADRTLAMERTIGGRPVTIRVITGPDLASALAGEGGYGGQFSGELRVAGSPGAPVLKMTGRAGEIVLAGVPSGRLELDLSYADSTLTVRTCALSGDASEAWVKGTYPYRVRLLPPCVQGRAAPVDMSGLFENLNVGLLSGITRHVPDAHGQLSGAVTVAGRGDAPHVSGSLLLRDGGFRIPGRGERIHDAQGMARVDSLGLHIEQLSARSGDDGKIEVQGWIRDAEAFDLSARAEKIRLFEPGVYDMLVDAQRLRAVANPQAEEHAGPHLSGHVEILRGQFMPNLGGGEKAPARAATPSPWRVDLDVTAPGDIRVTQANATAELGEGQLRLSYRWPYWNVSGSVAVLGGTYRLLNNNFTIQDGSVEFRDTGQGPQATVSVSAETYVVTADTTDMSAGDILVMVTVEGEPDELQVSLSSEPAYSPEQIVELLSYGRLPRTAWEAASETPTFLLGTMGGAIESSLAEQFPLFSHISLEHGATAQDMRLSVRPMISPGITGSYSQELSLDPAWDFSLHYRLSRILYLRAGVANDPERTGPFIDEYSLDLKFRFEYE